MPISKSHRIAARIAVIKLRSLLVADAHIALRHRQELLDLTATLIDGREAAMEYKKRLVELIKVRFGRNPDTFEASAATTQALRLLDAVQGGSFPTDASGGRSKPRRRVAGKDTPPC